MAGRWIISKTVVVILIFGRTEVQNVREMSLKVMKA
jgi:hypothetical protein